VLEGCATLLGDLIHDLSTDAVPEATGARSSKRLNLERGPFILQRDRHNPLGGLLNLQAELHAPLWIDSKTAQVNRGLDRAGLAVIEWPRNLTVVRR
jgi:hypothetical protein